MIEADIIQILKMLRETVSGWRTESIEDFESACSNVTMNLVENGTFTLNEKHNNKFIVTIIDKILRLSFIVLIPFIKLRFMVLYNIAEA